MGLKASSLEISSLALVHRGTSTTTTSLAGAYCQEGGHTVEDGLGLVGKEGDVAICQLSPGGLVR